LTLSRSAGQLLNALAAVLIVRKLAQFEYGTYRQVLLLYSSVLLVGDADLSQSLYNLIPGRREQAGAMLGRTALATLLLSAVWAASLVGVAGLVAKYFGNPQLVSLMPLLAAYLALSLLAQAPEAWLITLQRIGTTSFNIGFYEGLKFILILSALAWDANVSGLLLAMLIAVACRLVHFFLHLRGDLEFSAPLFSGEQWAYSMMLWLPGLLNIAAIYAHQYIVGHYFEPATYAVYAVACFQIPFMGVLVTSIGEVLLVRATELRLQGRQAEIRRVWLSACRKAQVLFLPVTVALAVLARPLITALFSERYLASVALFVVIVLGLPFQGIFQDAMFRAYSAMRLYFFFYVLRLVLALGLGLAGVHWLGLWGAALSTLLVQAIVNVWQLTKVKTLVGLPFGQVLPWKEIGKIGLTSAGCGVLAAAATQFVRWAPLALLVGLGVFGMTYLTLAVKLSLISYEEMRNLKEGIRAGFGRLAWLRPKAT
jgi:O-antigen/teichoic acid export membrane protein